MQTQNSEFHTLLSEFRERKEWSQVRLARESRVERSYLNRLESGKRMPSRETIMRLACALELSTGEEDRLLLAGGFAPGSQSKPLLMELILLMGDHLSKDPINRQEFMDALEEHIKQAAGDLARKKKLSSEENAA